MAPLARETDEWVATPTETNPQGQVGLPTFVVFYAAVYVPGPATIVCNRPLQDFSLLYSSFYGEVLPANLQHRLKDLNPR